LHHKNTEGYIGIYKLSQKLRVSLCTLCHRESSFE
jgi:hypothetical protein